MTTDGVPNEARGAAPPSAVTTENARLATGLAQPLVGQSLIQLCLAVGDTQLRFTGDFTVALEGPVKLAAARDVAVDPCTVDGMALLLPLLNGDVNEVDVSDDGALSLTVADRSLHCGADPDFEAWHIAGPGGLLVVSTPGGGLAIWDAV